MATKTKAKTEVVKAWAGDWADAYAQDWTPERMAEFVGCRVKVTATVEDEPKGAEGDVVGYDRTVLFIKPEPDTDFEEVYRSSFVLDDGVAIPIFADAVVEVIPDVEEDAEDEG